jgi:hypothetical protein
VVEPGAWVVLLSAVLGAVAAFVLRTRAPAWAVAILLAGTGAVLAWGGMLLRPDPGTGEVVIGVAAMAVLVPLHVRIVLGPFGRRPNR